MVASSLGDEYLVHMFLGAGADTSMKEVTGITALHHAAINNQAEIATILMHQNYELNFEADVNKMTPLVSFYFLFLYIDGSHQARIR